MKKKVAALFLTAWICAGSLSGFSQVRNDFGSWLSVELSKDLSKRFSAELEEEVRIFRNFGEIDRFATSLGGAFSIIKPLKAGAGYAWIYNHDVNDDLWENRHRYYIYIQGKAGLGRFDFTLREKFQSTFYDKSIAGYGYSPQNYLRSRLQVKYDIKGNPAEPYLAAEMHYQLNNPKGNEIDNMRYTLGVEFPLSKKLDLDTYLRLNHDVNKKKPDHLYLIGINLKIGL